MFRHVGIVVQNMKIMSQFYCDVFNLNILYDEIEEGEFLNTIIGENKAQAHILKLGKDNTNFLELLDYNISKKSKAKKIIEHGITHFALTVQNIDVIYNKLLNQNIPIINPPKETKDKTVKVCFCLDPENNLIELVQVR